MTICVEGVSNRGSKDKLQGYGGSHAAIHHDLEKRLKDNGIGIDDPISFDQTVDLVAENIQATFPESQCREKCLKEQMEQHYRRMCPGIDGQTMSAANTMGSGGPRDPSDDDIQPTR